MTVKVISTPNPVPQSGGPRTLWTLYDADAGFCVSRTGKPVSGHGAPLFDTEVGAQIVADELNGPRACRELGRVSVSAYGIVRHVRVSAEAQAFVSHMIEAEGWALEDVLYFLEKPWKWGEEFSTFSEKASTP